MDGIAGKRIAVVDEYYTESVLRLNTDTAAYTLVEVDNVTEGLRQVSLGQVDYFFDNVAYCAWYLERESISNLKVAGETPYTWNLSFAISRKYPELHGIITKALESVPEETLDAIRRKWTAGRLSAEFPRWIIVAIVILVMAVVALLIRGRTSMFLARREVEHARLKLARQLLDITSQLPGAMMYQIAILPDGQRRFLFLSEGITRLHGLEARAVLQDPGVLYAQFHPDDRAGISAAEAAAMQSMGCFRYEARIVHPQHGIRWSLFTSSPERQPDGSVIWKGIELDITELKDAQLALNAEREKQERLKEQLHQAQKMEAVGQLAGGVAHDFNNALGGIIGAAELLKTGRASPEKQVYYLDLILGAADRAADLTRKLLSFSRSSPKSFVPVDCADILRESVAILEHTISRGIAVTVENRADCTRLAGDGSLLQSVFMNLGINAAQAMPDGGRLSFVLHNLEFDDAYCRVSPFKLRPGRYLGIDVQDTGCGIPAEHLSRIFDPFFTTKPAGHGTGLGLSTVYGTIQEHGGAITVYSEVGKGTVFHIHLPLSPDLTAPAAVEAPVQGGSGTILVVDDEEMIRSTASGMLESLGYTVICAANGKEGLDLFRARGEDIDLVILDMIMPVMGGREAFAQFRLIDATTPILVASGFAKDADWEALRAGGGAGFVHKPFRRRELAEKVHAAIHTA